MKAGLIVYKAMPEKLVPGRFGGCLPTVADAKLAVDVLEVKVHCLVGDEQPRSYFFVTQPLGQQREDLLLAGSQGFGKGKFVTSGTSSQRNIVAPVSCLSKDCSQPTAGSSSPPPATPIGPDRAGSSRQSAHRIAGSVPV